jgi:hypothetical protein
MAGAGSFDGAVLGMCNPLLDISAHVGLDICEKCAWDGVRVCGRAWLDALLTTTSACGLAGTA